VAQHLSLQYAAVPAQPWAALEQRWLPLLPSGKRAALERLREPSDRNASLLGIALLARALAALELAFDPCALEFPTGSKPCLRGGPDFSISHAAGRVAAVAVATGRVGLDLEPAGSVRDSTARRVLGSAECARLADGTLTATDAWVMKEASVKLAGRGVESLRSVSLENGVARLGTEAYVLQRVDLGAGYCAWLALEHARGDLAPCECELALFAPLPGAA
jgi:phosphopantetheinyl transferase